MAVLQRIRNKASIFVIIFVGVALFLFIIDPSTFQVLFQRNDTNIAKINGKKIDYSEFQEFYNYHREFALIMNNKGNLSAEEDQRLYQFAWNEILQKNLFEPNINEVGLNVSDEELEDLLYGSNIHYIISQNFTNQQTGIIDTAQVKNFFDRADEDQKTYIIAEYFKKFIKQDRTTNKYDNMVAKGFYTPVAFAKMEYLEKTNLFDFELISKNFRAIPDEEINVTDTDILKYYEKYKYRYYEPKETRDIEYVVFDITPSSEDTININKEIKELYNEFNSLSEGYAEFAISNDEFREPSVFLSKENLPAGLPEDFFEQAVGTTSDIILNKDTFFFTRIIDEAIRPDSVMISHILLLKNDSVTIEDCRVKADSIEKLAKNGEDFSILALINSDDNDTKIKGGDIGWYTEAKLRKDISDIAFKANVGDIERLETDYGIHIFKITNQPEKHKMLKLATVNRLIKFSEQTTNKRFSDASNFCMNNNTAELFDKAIINENLIKRVATIGALDNKFSNIEDAREIVKWAYGKDMKIGNISEVYNFPDKYIVAKVSSIKPKGISPLELVSEKVKASVISEKKAEKDYNILVNDLKTTSSLLDIAQKYGITVDTIKSLSFNSFSIPGIGIEPKINGLFYSIDQNKLSEPIIGNSGVYIINVSKKIPAPEKTDYSSEQLNSMRSLAGQIYRISEAIEKSANIEDYRVKFF